MLTRLLVALVLLLPLAASPARAEFGFRLGMLTCEIDGGLGVFLGSRKDLICVYRPAGNAPRETYTGSITKVGIDVGATGGSALAWLVFAATTQLSPGFLEGLYLGVTAEATPGVGVGGNVLIGGFDRSIVLQPISVQGQVGVNIAAGIAGLRLVDAQPVAAPVYKR